MKSNIKILIPIIFLIILICNNKVIAQGVHWDWAIKGAVASVYDMGSDASSNLYISGSTGSNDTVYFNSTMILPNHSFLAKYDNQGNFKWVKGIQNSRNGRLSIDANACIYVAGIFWDTIIFGGNIYYGQVYSDVYIAKYDSSGNELWMRTGVGNYIDGGMDVKTDRIGNVYFTGYFLSDEIWFDTIVLTKSGVSNTDMFVVKYNPSGNLLWAKSYGSGGYSLTHGESIACDSNNNVYITGTFSTTTTFDTITLPLTSNSSDFFLLKYNSAGHILWARNSGTSFSSDGRQYVVIDKLDNVIISGANTCTFTLNGTTIVNHNPDPGYYDSFLVKYNTNGNIIWVKSAVSGNRYDFTWSMRTDNQNNIFLFGNFTSDTANVGSIILYNSGNVSEGFVAKYNSAGNIVWAKKPACTNYDIIRSGIVDNNGNIFAAGNFADSISFGNFNLYGSASFIAKLSEYDGIEENNPYISQIKTYPNPSNGNFTIDLNNIDSKMVDLRMYNIQGVQVFHSKKENSDLVQINLPGLSDGLYLIQLQTDKYQIYQSKIMISK